MRISDWISDVCSSDLHYWRGGALRPRHLAHARVQGRWLSHHQPRARLAARNNPCRPCRWERAGGTSRPAVQHERSEEHTSELQSLMRISYAVFCLKKQRNKTTKKQKRKTKRYNI